MYAYYCHFHLLARSLARSRNPQRERERKGEMDLAREADVREGMALKTLGRLMLDQALFKRTGRPKFCHVTTVGPPDCGVYIISIHLEAAI